jgi:hypothetical protein
VLVDAERERQWPLIVEHRREPLTQDRKLRVADRGPALDCRPLLQPVAPFGGGDLRGPLRFVRLPLGSLGGWGGFGRLGGRGFRFRGRVQPLLRLALAVCGLGGRRSLGVLLMSGCPQGVSERE